jgi:hypothetical protein
MTTRSQRGMRRFVRRNRSVVAVALLAAIASSGTTAAATALFLATTNTASTTTTLKSGVNGGVFQVTNTNSTGGTSAKGIGITVPAGRAPITVNSTAGKATNLNADKLDGLDSSKFVKTSVQAWREIGAAGQPGFSPLCGGSCLTVWQNFGAGHNTAAFYKDPLGVVHLKGTIANNGIPFNPNCREVPFFTLPAGYRPAAITVAAILRNDTLARVDISPNGEVALCRPNVVNGGDWYALDGITFRAAQ